VSDSRIRFADCTLRDGEQAPGVFFTLEEKLEIADLLDAAGVDLIDAGMPSVSQEERDALAALVARNYRATVAATVRALRSDIDLALDCGVTEVFLFMPVSPQHLKHKFGINLRQAQYRIEDAVRYAVSKRLRVHFVAEDSVRADPQQLAHVFDRVSELGAVSAIICDTVGVMTPQTMEKYVRTLRESMKRPLTLGIHCHNDYGLGTANTLAAVNAGCTLVTSTINGLGERAGNAVFEEVVCALDDLYQADLSIDKMMLTQLSETVARASGMFIVPTKPVVGFNVFRHESGVHVDGMLKDPSTYESICPKPLGRSHELLLGKHSGRGLIEFLLADKGIASTPDLNDRILERIKTVKVSTNKAPLRAMAERLTELWSRHLSFSEEDFWTIVYDEMSEAFARPRQKANVLADGTPTSLPVLRQKVNVLADGTPTSSPRQKVNVLADGTPTSLRVPRQKANMLAEGTAASLRVPQQKANALATGTSTSLPAPRSRNRASL
jgi:isopropylmalate/homocitrate/citramalate synthase